MKLTSVLLTILVAVFLQVVLARYTVGGTWAFDLVLVGVVFAALQWGPAAGMVGGTMGGLLQDLLAGEIVGVGALPKTIVGFIAGLVGIQFVLNRPHARVAVVAVGSLLHRLMIAALGGLIDQQWPAVFWSAMLAETAINSACALVLFQAASMLPGVMERQRISRRSTFSRRQW